MNLVLLPSPSLLETTGLVSVGIGLVFLGRPFLRRTLGSRVVAALWLVLAVRLLCPWSFASPWHLSLLTPGLAGQENSTAATLPPSIRVSVADAPASTASPSIAKESLRDLAPSTHGSRLLGWPGWTAVWLAGVVLSFVNLVRGVWQVHLWAARTAPGQEAPALQAVFDALPVLDRQGVGLRLTDDFPVPTLAGIFHPQIWFPRAWSHLDPAELRHVLLHELGHARRRDLLAQFLCSLACCLHWFNPLVWLLARWARADRELACDAWVLACAVAGEGRGQEHAAYGRTLLKIVGGLRTAPFSSASAAMVAMAADRHNLGLRIREIGSFRPLPRWRGACLLGTAAVGLSASVFAAPTSAEAPSLAGPPPAASVAPVKGFIPALSTNAPAPGPTPGNNHPPDSSDPAGSTAPSPSPGSSPPAHRHGIEIESKFVEFSREALRAFEKVRRKTPSQRFLAQQFSALGAGKPAAGLASRVAFPLLGVFKEEEFQELVRQMNTTKGVDLLSAPRVTTKSGQKATVEIVREMLYPDTFDHGRDATGKPVVTPSHFDKKNTGLSLEVEPTLVEDTVIDLKLACQVVTFEGFIQGDGAPRTQETPVDNTHPVFQTQKLETAVSIYSDSTVLLGKTLYQPGSWQALGKHDASKEEGVILVFITARIVDLGAPPPPASSPPGPDPSAAVSGPGEYAVPVPGKLGFVTSPYAPNSGYVDVTGYHRGDSVLDPYSGKFFLVP